MTDAKGDRSLRPAQQPNPDTYVHIVERRADGIVISGTKAIVTAAPYVHELLVMPGRNMTAADRDFAVCCAVPVDADGLTIVARPAGRPGESGSELQRQVRAVDRRVPVRPRVRALGARVLRRRVAARRRVPLRLHDAAPPHLHRARAPASATC